MKKLHGITLLVAALAFLLAAVAQAAPKPKVTICHFPPGNPANWHTITISENALQKHQDKHGDLIGIACEDATCEQLSSDGDACTQDVMASEECIPLPFPRPPVDCEDDNPCSQNDCDSVDGCLNTPEPAGWPCMENDLAGVCDGAGTCDLCADVVCDAPDQCQEAGTCNAGVCEYPDAPDGTTCDDGDPNTTGDMCNTGTCEGELDLCLGVDCDDSNSCTADSCDPATGACINDASGTDGDICDDGDPDTTGDMCNAGTCEGELDLCDGVVCDDGNSCTADSCDPATGACVNDASGTDGDVCDDGDSSTTGDMCNAGTCEGDPAVADCSSCTADSQIACGLFDAGLRIQSCYTCSGYYECGDAFVFPTWEACPAGEAFDVNTQSCGTTSGTCSYADGGCTGGAPPIG